MSAPVTLLGVPMDLGADRRGVDMGPSAIRYAGLQQQIAATGRSVTDAGDLSVPHPAQREPTTDDSVPGRAKYLTEAKTVCGRVASAVEDVVADDGLPLVLGGDHSIAIGTARGASTAPGDLGVLWFDAHGDFNTPRTTPSGNVHGMPLAAILGIGEFADLDWTSTDIDPANVAIVGLRDVDDEERDLLRDSSVSAYTMTDLDDRGVPTVLGEALEAVTRNTDGLYLSLDMDSLDPGEAPGVGTLVRGGVSYREAHYAMETIARQETPLQALEIAEVNPILDDHNRTAELACEIAASALGKRIL